MPWLRHACLLLLVLLGGQVLADDSGVQPVPDFSGYVIDQTNTLTPEQQQSLSARLDAFARQKGSQVAVLIVPTTAPEDIFSYSFRVADHWKLGRKGVDDGVLLVVAVQDHKDNIQVGYGLEGALPDVTAKRILQDIMSPYLHQGDFNGGINAGVDAIIKVVNGEPLPAPTHSYSHRNGNFLPGMIFGIFFAAIFLRAILGRTLGGLAGGLAGGAIAFTFGLSLFLALGIGVVVAVILWVGQSSGGYYGGGGFGGGGFGGGGFGGGGSFGGGGGGFSGGGGGGFGGGGASGNW